jgi:hypothetical protein
VNASQGRILRFIASKANDPERYEAMVKEKEAKEGMRSAELEHAR